MNDHSPQSFRPTSEWTQHLRPSTSTFQSQMSQPSDTSETRKPCRYCGHPEASAKDWAEIEPGKGEELGLCWDGEVCRHDAEAAIDRLMSERDAAREEATMWRMHIKTCLQYPRGSEAQVRCLEEVGQDAAYYDKQLTKKS